MALSVGDSLDDRYKILKYLGRGGRGDVYLAEDRLLARRVAVKHLRPGSVREQADVVRFLAEAQAIADIHHENVVTIYDVIEEGGENYYLVLEYAEEGTVADLLQREGRLPVLQALELGLAAARALEVVHAEGILHRDIKPSNILLMRTRDGHRAKLADFGLSRVMGETETDEGSYFGSILYTSPEQLRGEAVDGRADLYALGAVLYEMLTGQPPFGKSEDLHQIMHGHLQSLPVPPSQLNSDVSPVVDDVVSKVLRKDPGERYSDARAMGQALRRAMEEHRDWRKRVQMVYTQGIEHERIGEWGGAISCFEAVLADRPNYPEARRRLEQARQNLDWERLYQEGLAAYEQGAWAKAEGILLQVIAHDKSYADGDAVAKLEEVQRQRDLERWYEEAARHEEGERWSKAVDLYLKILTLGSDYRDVPARLARAAGQQKRKVLYEKAREHMVAKSWAEAVKTLQELERLRPGYKDSAFLLAEAERQRRLDELYTEAIRFLREGDWISASANFTKVVQIEPEYEDAALKRAIAERQARLVDLYDEARAQMEAEEWAAAAVTLQEIKEAEPSYGDVGRLLNEATQKQHTEELYQKGVRLYEEEEWEQAIQYLGKVQQAQPGYRDVERRLNQAQSAQRIHALYAQARQSEVVGNWADAVGAYTEILRLDPSHRNAKVGLARVSAVALGREQPSDAKRRERLVAIGGALLVIVALSCMLLIPMSRFVPLSPERIAAVIFPTSVTTQPATMPTATSLGGAVPATITKTLAPTPTQTATPTPVPSFTSTWTPSPTPCVPYFEFLDHLTIPDGTTVYAGATFTKSWLLKNVNSCPLPEESGLVSVGDNPMDGLSEHIVKLLPNSTGLVTASVSLVAPESEGEHEGLWQIQDAGGIPISEAFHTSVFVRRRPTPTPSYSRPILGRADKVKCNVTFYWTWDRVLANDEYFALRVGIGNPGESKTWTKETRFTYTFEEDPREYVWEVAICRGDPSTHICEQLAVSELAPYEFTGCWKDD